jgi:hypothetical protein
MTGCPFGPQPFDYLGGVNQRAIEIKKNRITHQFVYARIVGNESGTMVLSVAEHH